MRKVISFLIPAILISIFSISVIAATTNSLDPVFLFIGDAVNVVCIDGEIISKSAPGDNDTLRIGCRGQEAEPTRVPTATNPAPPTPTDPAPPTATVPAPPTATVPPPPTPGDHPANAWHPPSDHHHGVNPAEVAPDLYALLNNELRPDYIVSELHKGDVYLYADAGERGDGVCDNSQGNTTFDGCVKRILLRVHNVGHEAHSMVRFHTTSFAAEVCNPAGTQCGLVSGHQFTDYGTAHQPYKKAYAADTYDQAPVPLSLIDQPPYRTSTVDIVRATQPGGRGVTGFWSSLGPNPIVSQYYDDPNNLIEVAWSNSDGWQYVPAIGAEPLWVCDFLGDPDCEYNGTRYQIFTIRIKIEDITQRPFSGFTDPDGNVNPACTEAGPDCYEFYIGEGVPVGVKFELNRPVAHNIDSAAPVYEFDTGSGITRP